jgi:hypothetical protein
MLPGVSNRVFISHVPVSVNGSAVAGALTWF